MQANAGGGSSSLPGFLQDTRVQIGVAVAAIIAIGFIVWTMLGPSLGGGSAATTATVSVNGPAVDTGAASITPAGNAPGGLNTAAAGADTGTPAPVPAPPAGAPGATPPKEAKKPGPGPRPPSKGNPFTPNSELEKVIASKVKPPEFLNYPAPQDLYRDLHKPKPVKLVSGEDDTDGPPVPPMRLAGIIQGADRLTAMLQMGSRFMAVHPGQKVPDENEGPYRVDTIEPNRILLSRNYEVGDHKAVQKVEVALSDGQKTTPAFGAPGGYPGGGYPGGYPGGVGGFPGGYPGGGYPGGGYPGGFGRKGFGG